MTALLHRSASTCRIDRESVLDDVLEDVANRLQAGDPVDCAAILAGIPSTPNRCSGCCRPSR